MRTDLIEVLRTTALEYRYARQMPLQFPDMQLFSQQACAVVGPSGCGKSTLLHLVVGLLAGQSGQVHLLGHDMAALSIVERDRHRGRHVGMVFQRLHLLPGLTVLQNVLAPAHFGGHAINEAFALALLDELGVGTLSGKRPNELSFGQAQRVAIARALVTRPALLVADEPTSGLDDANAERVMRLLLGSATKHGAALLVASHDQRVKAMLPQVYVLAASSS